ncbi:hypothetical protein P4O66_002845 [Electrophorus voltai]|uniref:Reverse transcriptase domain-containing protein n=1 Tax=Electrophorus voltai TaxID=2609070 RepID=A0AAD8YWR6_9TELE|nr:hypothetical protein P4O66_002845 [Electrophorus voltai]
MDLIQPIQHKKAFNTVIPSKLITKLEDLGLYPSLWIPLDLQLPHRQITSSAGGALSPMLYSLYTYYCVATPSTTIIVKFANDTVVVLPHQLLGEDTCWRLCHLRHIKDLRLRSKVLTGNITAWFGNSTKQDTRAVQRVVSSAESIIQTKLPNLQTIYYSGAGQWCWTRKIVKDPRKFSVQFPTSAKSTEITLMTRM